MSEVYEIRVTARARRDLDKLPESVAAAVIEFMAGPLAENPHRVGKRLRAELTGLHSARRGSYRVVYAIDDGCAVIEVTHIDHRGAVYRT